MQIKLVYLLSGLIASYHYFIPVGQMNPKSYLVGNVQIQGSLSDGFFFFLLFKVQKPLDLFPLDDEKSS